MEFQEPKRVQTHFSQGKVEAWALETILSIKDLHLSPSRGTADLSIPLDAAVSPNQDKEGGTTLRTTYVPRRELGRRDSLKRRDALLKGKEGSRRRQRWENDRLLGNPHAQPPLPTDWDVRPTHPVRSVPYYLAALWDKKYADGKRRSLQADRPASGNQQAQSSAGRIPKTLKDRLKRSRSAKGLLQDLEQEIRNFIESYDGSVRSSLKDLALDDDDYVLIPHHMPEQSRDDIEPLPQPEKLIFEGLEDDPTASFLRFLVHSLGRYYDLDSWSVTVGDPARREAYVRIKHAEDLLAAENQLHSLPRPMWTMV